MNRQFLDSHFDINNLNINYSRVFFSSVSVFMSKCILFQTEFFRFLRCLNVRACFCLYTRRNTHDSNTIYLFIYLFILSYYKLIILCTNDFLAFNLNWLSSCAINVLEMNENSLFKWTRARAPVSLCVCMCDWVYCLVKCKCQFGIQQSFRPLRYKNKRSFTCYLFVGIEHIRFFCFVIKQCMENVSI